MLGCEWPFSNVVASPHRPARGVALRGILMSVTAIVHFPVADVAKAIEGLKSQAALLEEITQDTKGAGIIRHRFVAGEGELVVIDEWETAEQFEAFFEANVKIGEISAAVGLTGAPAASVFAAVEAPGTLG